MGWMKWTIRILSAIIEKFKGGPVGITTISTAVGEESGTIEEVYEPFLNSGRLY
jgi:Holliday junction DNA helicase RuvB